MAVVRLMFYFVSSVIYTYIYIYYNAVVYSYMCIYVDFKLSFIFSEEWIIEELRSRY